MDYVVVKTSRSSRIGFSEVEVTCTHRPHHEPIIDFVRIVEDEVRCSFAGVRIASTSIVRHIISVDRIEDSIEVAMGEAED
jgi:hypothetical protein